MISSYFGDARASGMMGNTAELLFENPDILAFSDITYDKNGAERFMDTIFTNIDAKGSEGSDRRKLGLSMLFKALETETRFTGEVLCDSRLKQMMDRLPTLFDAIDEEEEASALVKVLELLLMRDAATTSSLSKVLPKYLKNMFLLEKIKEGTPIGEEGNKKHNMVFVMAVQLLTVVGRSAYRNLLMQHIDTIMSSCIQIRGWQDSESMLELFGLVSLESPAAWEGVWRTLTDYAALVLREYLDIDLRKIALVEGLIRWILVEVMMTN